MMLHYQTLGAGPPLVILHGLFGSHDNWLPIARRLAPRLRLLLPDLRNHGQSPRADEMDYPSMARDIVELLDGAGLDRAHIAGHSMGGKVAMRLALDFPARVSSLMVVDIAPKEYEPRHFHIINALLKLPVENLTSRAEADAALASSIPDVAVRQFLLKSLARSADGRLHWRLNLPAIEQNYQQLNAFLPEAQPWPGRALFIKGELSDYLLPGDEPRIRSLFPKAQISVIPSADHWVHADAPDAVANAISDFIRE